MNRMNFEEPTLELCRFAVEDIVTTSSTLTTVGADSSDNFGSMFG